MEPTPTPTPPGTSLPDRASGVGLGVGLAVTGVAALILAGRIAYTPLGDNHDPGPRAFPIALGLLLLAGGTWEIVRGLGARGARGARGVPRGPAGPAPRSRGEALILLAAVVAYVPAMAWLGFSLATLIFATAMMVRLGSRWGFAVGTALGMVIVVHLLFVTLFRVQLPVGVLGLPF